MTQKVKTMAKRSSFLRRNSIATLDVLAILAGTVIAVPIALAVASLVLTAF